MRSKTISAVPANDVTANLSDTSEAWRLFIAIEIPDSVRRLVRQHIDRLRAALPEVRASWTREQNLHLTLKFLGNTPVAKAEELSRAVQRAAAKVPPFELVIRDCGLFPARGKPKVLWIGMSDSSGNLDHLYRLLEEECEQLGFPRETRSFHPHLTIARLREAQGDVGELHKSNAFPAVEVIARDVCVIRSELSNQGSRYTTIARHALAI